jgi:UDP-2,3-diacylglucosamine pyrophosphatase LpxH
MASDIFVISDLHIGDGGPRDNFGHAGSDRTRQLMPFLGYVERENGELIILGDLFDFWQANLSRVLTGGFSTKLIEKLGQLKVTYVIGNHDIDLVGFIDQKMLSPALFQALSGPFSRQIGGKTFQFMHGHEIDPYNRDEVPGKGRLLTIFAGMAESFVGSPNLADGRSVETVLEQRGEGALNQVKAWGRRVLARILLLFGVQSNELSPAQNPDRAAEMLLKYKAHKDENGYDVLVVGHTHQPGRMDGWYFNTGSWATADNNFVRITPAGGVQVFDWADGKARPNDTVLSLQATPREAKGVRHG